MQEFNKTTAVLTALVAGLAVLTVALHSSEAHAGPQPIPVSLPASLLAERRVDEQYRTSAAALAPAYDTVTLAGSGAPGARDGIGLYAQFRDPVDMSLSPDGRHLLVLDDGGLTIRRVDTETRVVVTLTDWRPADPRMGSDVFSRVIATADGMFLVDSSSEIIVVARQGRTQVARVEPGGPSAVSDLVYENGRLFVLEGASGRVFSFESGRWKVVATLTPGIYERLSVDADQVVAVSVATGAWSRYDVKSGSVSKEFPAKSGAVQVLTDTVNARYLALFGDGISAVARSDFSTLTHLPLSDLQGRRVDEPDAMFGYNSDWLSGVVRMAFDARRNTLYALNRRERRVTMMLSSFVNWTYGQRDLTPRPFLSPDYPVLKPAGVSRILWLSHSVFWDPAGLADSNLALGAPRQLELLLNTTDAQAGRWEVLNPGLTGAGFYTTVYPRTKMVVKMYGFDYAVMVLDLQTLYWMVQNNGVMAPAAFDAAGLPIEIDAELARQPMLERHYAEPLRPLVDYMKANMQEPSARIPLLTATGTLVERQFMRAWTEDAQFRSLLLGVYVDLIKGVSKACDEAGVKLTVLVAPMTYFVAANEWIDVTNIGGKEHPYDFEAVHRPILQRLWAEGIPAYDLTFDMLARHPRLFPFNAPSHHRSERFHQAVAESVAAVAHRFNVFSFLPRPERAPIGGAAPASATPPNVVVTERGDACFVLHDMWDGRKTPEPGFSELLALGVSDATRSVGARTVGCSEYRVTFVYVKNKDDYGNRDFRGVESVASMRLPVPRLNEFGAAARAHADTAQVRAAVQFEHLR